MISYAKQYGIRDIGINQKVQIGFLLFLIIIFIPTFCYSQFMTSTMQAIDADSTTWVDISSVLPYGGTFDNGTIGWTSNISGGGKVNSYSIAGWIGLYCARSTDGSAQLQTYNYNASSILDISTIGRRDMILASVYVKSTTLFLGTFTLSIGGAYPNQPITLIHQANFQGDTTSSNNVSLNINFTRYDFVFIPPTQDYYKMYNLSLTYSVSSLQSIPSSSEMLVDRIALYAHRVH